MVRKNESLTKFDFGTDLDNDGALFVQIWLEHFDRRYEIGLSLSLSLSLGPRSSASQQMINAIERHVLHGMLMDALVQYGNLQFADC